MKWLFQNWNTIVESIPTTLLDTSSFSSEPKITSRFGRNGNDPYSSDASADGKLDSYGTILLAMFEADADDASIATTSETDMRKLPNIQAPVSFAKVVAVSASITLMSSVFTTPTIEAKFRAELEQLRKENDAMKQSAMDARNTNTKSQNFGTKIETKLKAGEKTSRLFETCCSTCKVSNQLP